MGRGKELFKNTAIFAVGEVTIKIIQFLLLPLITRKIALNDFGESENWMALIELLFPILTLGISDSIFRFSIGKDNSKAKAAFSTGIFIFITTSAFFVLGVLIYFINRNLQYYLLIIFLYFSIVLNNFFSQYLRAIKRLKIYISGGILKVLGLALVLWILFYRVRYTKYSYLLAIVISNYFSILFWVVFGKLYKELKFKEINVNLFKRMVKYSLPLIPNMLSWWIIQTLNRYIVTYYHGDASNGLYISTLKIGAIITAFSVVFMQAWTISAVEAKKDEDRSVFNTMVYGAFNAFIKIGTSLLLIALFPIAKFLLRGEFFEVWRYSSFSIIMASYACYAAFYGVFYGVEMKSLKNFLSTFISAIVSAIFSISLIPKFGIQGALYSGVIAYAFLSVYRCFDTKKYSNIEIPYVKNIVTHILLLCSAFSNIYLYVAGEWIVYAVQACSVILITLLYLKDLKFLFLIFKGIIKKGEK